MARNKLTPGSRGEITYQDLPDGRVRGTLRFRRRDGSYGKLRVRASSNAAARRALMSQGAAQLAAFFVAYFGAIPSLVNAVIHPYDEAATPEAIIWAVFWCVLLLLFIALVAVMTRYARYMHQWWRGEVATRVIESYVVPLHLVARPHDTSRSRRHSGRRRTGCYDSTTRADGLGRSHD